ncbi:MAG: monovalent cation/H+ antiporter complex subunit F, partial [Pseudomonadota bacterium]
LILLIFAIVITIGNIIRTPKFTAKLICFNNLSAIVVSFILLISLMPGSISNLDIALNYILFGYLGIIGINKLIRYNHD